MDEIDPLVQQELMDVVLRYATGIDTRDWQLLRTCFTDDCQADYGDVGTWDSGDAVTAYMEQVHADCGHTMHWIGNHVVHADGDGYTARTYVEAIVLRGDNQKGFQFYGYYDDRFVQSDKGWKISSRTFRPTVTTRVLAYSRS
jgi:hypothetical protein